MESIRAILLILFLLSRVFVSTFLVVLAASQVACAQGPAATPPAEPVFDPSAYHWLADESAALPPLAPLHSVFVSPGSPGHTVMVLDVAVGGDGSRFGLIGQGYTPAQELHIISDSAGDVWFPLPASSVESLNVPSWSPFPKRTARRFTEPSVDTADH